MRRRRFLKSVGATAAGLGAGAFGILKYPRTAQAAWGEWPEDKMDALLPANRRAKNVLEVYMYGGVNPWDTFYTVPGWGGNSRFLNAYQAETNNYFNNVCGFSGNLSEEFAEDEGGTMVHLGPWTWPLRQRPDIVDRMRILTTRHDQFAHEGANPLMLSGSRLGSPRLAGVGSSIQRYFLEQPGGLRATPYAWVLYPGSEFATDNVRAASSVGLHPGTATPLSLTVASNSKLFDLLARDTVDSFRPEFDAAIGYYEQRYRNRFRFGGKGSPTRSQTRDNYEFANFTRNNSAAIQGVLDPMFFQNINDAECNRDQKSMPAMQARLAAALLTRNNDQARFVQMIDAGLDPHPSAGHDTHWDHVDFSAPNVSHTLAKLAEIINEPNEDDPDKINLDDTLIVLTTEFGRTAAKQGDTGLNHWPGGFCTVLIGGPVTAAEKGVVGYATEEEGFAEKWMNPAEIRMTIMAALGIYPFSSQTFAVGDVGGGVETELEAALRIKERYLGIA